LRDKRRTADDTANTSRKYIRATAVYTGIGRNVACPFSNAQAVTFLNIVEPGAKYGDRLNDVDLRFGKILKYGRTRTLAALDLFNVFNVSTPDVYSTFPYGATYLNPLNITSARFAKISVQIDF